MADGVKEVAAQGTTAGSESPQDEASPDDLEGSCMRCKTMPYARAEQSVCRGTSPEFGA
eukprot:gene285-25069_t